MSYFNQLNANDAVGNMLYTGSRVAIKPFYGGGYANKVGIIKHIVSSSNPCNPTCVIEMLDGTVVTAGGNELIKC